MRNFLLKWRLCLQMLERGVFSWSRRRLKVSPFLQTKSWSHFKRIKMPLFSCHWTTSTRNLDEQKRDQKACINGSNIKSQQAQRFTNEWQEFQQETSLNSDTPFSPITPTFPLQNKSPSCHHHLHIPLLEKTCQLLLTTTQDLNSYTQL